MAYPRLTRHMDTDLFVAAAGRLGLGIEVIDREASFVRIFNERRELFICDNHTGLTDAALRMFANDKGLTCRFLAQHGLPVPEGAVFATRRIDEILAFCGERAPVVVKPNSGSLGRGVSLACTTEEEVRRAVAEVEAAGSRVALVERYIPGGSFRALVHQGRVIDILERRPPFVVGDGDRTLRALVEEKDRQRAEKDLKPIVVEPAALTALGMDLDTVPEAGAHCILNRLPLLAVGAENRRLAATELHFDNLQLVEEVARTCRLALCGVDLLSPDITVSHRENGAVINEINSSPNVYNHFHADMGANLAPVERILAAHFA